MRWGSEDGDAAPMRALIVLAAVGFCGCLSLSTNVRADFYTGKFAEARERCKGESERSCLVLRPCSALHMGDSAAAKEDAQKTCAAKIPKDNVRFVTVLTRAYESTQQQTPAAEVTAAKKLFIEACGVDAAAVDADFEKTGKVTMGELMDSW